MSKSCKIVLIVIGVMMMACLAFTLISSLIVPKQYRASTYGVTDKSKSVLVLEDHSIFYILDITLDSKTKKTWNEITTFEGRKIITLSPGTHQISIHYSDHTDLSGLGFMEWYVSSIKTAEFTAVKNRAVILSLEGGSSSGMMYDPPDLVKKE